MTDFIAAGDSPLGVGSPTHFFGKDQLGNAPALFTANTVAAILTGDAALSIPELTSVGGTTTAYTATDPAAGTGFLGGRIRLFTPNATCGAAPTLNVTGWGGALSLKDHTGTSIAAGGLVSGTTYLIILHGSSILVLNLDVDLASEASARASADTTNAAAIDSEAETRAAADTSEAETRAAADTTNATAIASEATRATAAEGTLSAALALKPDTDVSAAGFYGRPTIANGPSGPVLLRQLFDGSMRLGLQARSDFLVTQRGPPGDRKIYAEAEGVPEFLVTTPYYGTDHRIISYDGYQLRWLSGRDDDGTSRRHTLRFDRFIEAYLGDLLHFHGKAGLGQSSEMGAANNVALTSAAARVFMCEAGVRVLGNDMLFWHYRTRVRLSDLINWLLASEYVHLGSGETGLVAAAVYHVEGDYFDATHAFFTCSCGVGSSSFDDNKVGSVAHDNYALVVSEQRLTALIHGKTYDLLDVFWPPHEASIYLGYSTQMTQLLQGQAELTAELANLVPEQAGQEALQVIGGSGNFGHYNSLVPGSGRADLAQVHIDAAILYPEKFAYAMPYTILNYLGDKVHPDGESKRLQGDYNGRAVEKKKQAIAEEFEEGQSIEDYRARLVDRIECVYPKDDAAGTGTEIIVDFHVREENAPLDFIGDERVTPLPDGNHGVVWKGVGGNAAGISIASMHWLDFSGNSQRLRIILSDTPAGLSSEQVLVGMQDDFSESGAAAGPRSEIADSCDAVGPSSGERLRNWCASRAVDVVR